MLWYDVNNTASMLSLAMCWRSLSTRRCISSREKVGTTLSPFGILRTLVFLINSAALLTVVMSAILLIVVVPSIKKIYIASAASTPRRERRVANKRRLIGPDL